MTQVRQIVQPGPQTEDTPRLKSFRASEFDGQPIQCRNWLVRNLISIGTTTLLAGDGGLGKSTLSLQLAVAVAAGVNFLGYQTARGRVVVVSAEDDIHELHRRIAAVAHAQSIVLRDLMDLHLVPLAGQDAVMAAPDGKARICETGVLRGLRELIARVRPCVVILDAAADIFGGDENVRAEVRQFLAMLNGMAIAHGLAVVLIAHPSVQGMASGSGFSGSTAWNNSVRSRFYLQSASMGKDDFGKPIPDPARRTLRHMKSNYGAIDPDIHLRLECGYFQRDESQANTRLVDEAFLQLLDQIIGEGRAVSPAACPTYAPKVFEEHPLNTSKFTKKDFKPAMLRLLAAGKIQVETSGPPSKERRHIVRKPVAAPTVDPAVPSSESGQAVEADVTQVDGGQP